MKQEKKDQFNTLNIINDPKFAKLSLQNVRHIHFVGIGGVSMSSLAIFAKESGFKVSGSDCNSSQLTKNLQNMGIDVFYSHNASNIAGANLVVYSNAVENNVEVIMAKNQNIKTMSRAVFLAQVLQLYKTTICVSGAHGKTTTTALIYSVLSLAKKQPSLHLGGNLVNSQKNYSYESNEYIICEACEYKDSFLEFFPNIGIILNIAPEHLDYFKNFENVVSSFNKFAQQSQTLIVNKACKINHKNKVTFGLSDANFTAKNIKMLKNGKYSFDCFKNNKLFTHINLNLIGAHNILNALACIATCYVLGINKKIIASALSNFCGVERRYQFLHSKKFIVHDYAHHPDEILSAIQETKKFYKNKLLVVFQPHTYSRTKTLLNNFIHVLRCADELVIIPTYSAREKYQYKGSALYLCKNVGANATYIKTNKMAINYIKNKIDCGYGVLFLGAGDIFDMAKNVAKMCWQPKTYVLKSIRLIIKKRVN